MTLGEKLQLLRKQNGWSQGELAQLITVSRQAISKWELGEAVPETENIRQLSDLFGVTTDYLIKDELESDNDLAAVKIAEIRTKSEEKRRQLLIWGFVTLIAGVIIIGVLFTLSQVIESRRKITEHISPGDVMIILPDGTTEVSDESRTQTTYIPDKGLIPFLNTYRLHWLFIAGCAMIIASAGLFGKYFHINGKKAGKRMHKRELP